MISLLWRIRNRETMMKRRLVLFSIVFIPIAQTACSTNPYHRSPAATMSLDPARRIETGGSSAENPTARPPELSIAHTIDFPRLYLTLDPSIPPFKSQMISVDLNSILSGNAAEAELITADSEFLGRDPNLTWAPDLSKAVFVNMSGVYLFAPATKLFSNLPPIPFHQTFVFWNIDSLRFAMVVENGKEFSSDILILDSQSGLPERFALDANRFPTVLGWKDSQTLFLVIEEFGHPMETEKAEIIDRKLLVLNVGEGSLAELLPDKNWLKTQAWQLSPDGNELLFRELLTAPEGKPDGLAQLLDLNTSQEREITIRPGIAEWINIEDMVVYDRGNVGEERISLTWLKNWREIQHVRFDAASEITEVLVTPDGSAVVVFLSVFSPNQPGVRTGYKALILTQDGQQQEFILPGIRSTDWTVQYAAWGK